MDSALASGAPYNRQAGIVLSLYDRTLGVAKLTAKGKLAFKQCGLELRRPNSLTVARSFPGPAASDDGF
jgi:hypothetical protein